MKKNKIGVIYCAFGDLDYAKKSLPAWLNARDTNLSDNQWVITAVSVPFKGYEDSPFSKDFSTTEWLKTQPLDYLVTEPLFMEEKDARNKALFYLLEQGCDWIYLADSDEFFSRQDIFNIARFISKDALTTWFSFSYKNYVFNENTYLEEPFAPPRAFKVDAGSYKLAAFYHDNEVYYNGKITRDTKDFKSFSNRNVPKTVSWVTHMTWMSNDRGRNKQNYQSSRWGSKFCSFIWNEKEQKLEFNPEYYAMVDKPIPNLLSD